MINHEYRIRRWASAAALVLLGGFIVGCVYILLWENHDPAGLLVAVPVVAVAVVGFFLFGRLLIWPGFYTVLADELMVQQGPRHLGRRLAWSDVERVQVRWTGGLVLHGGRRSVVLLQEVADYSVLVTRVVTRCAAQVGAGSAFEDRRHVGDWGQTVLVLTFCAAMASYPLATGHQAGPVLAFLAVLAAAKLVREEYRHPRRISLEGGVLSVHHFSATQAWDTREMTKLAVRPLGGIPVLCFESRGRDWAVVPLHRTRWLELYAAILKVAAR